MRAIYYAENIDHAQVAVKVFEVDYGPKHPKAVAKIVEDATCSWSSTSTRPNTGSI